MLVGELDEAARLLRVALAQPLAHFADEGAAGVGARLEAVGDLADGKVAVLKLLFVDIGVVDAVDVQRAQRIIIRDFIGLVVFVAKRFEEIHVDDRGAGGDDRVDHVRLHELGIKVHAAAGRGRSGNHQDDRAFGVLEHRVVDLGRAGEIAAGEAHLAHRIDDRAGVELGDVDMLDRRREQLGLSRVVDLRTVDQLFSGHGQYPRHSRESGNPATRDDLENKAGSPPARGRRVPEER